MAEYLLSLKGIEFLLSEKFNQDPLEIYFSKQWSWGVRGDNPSVQQCLQNAQAIRAAKILTLGNCSNICKRKAKHNIKELCAPCPSDDLYTLSITKHSQYSINVLCKVSWTCYVDVLYGYESFILKDSDSGLF